MKVRVIVTNLRKRKEPSVSSDSLGFAAKGEYEVFNTTMNQGYKWYKIGANEWIAGVKDCVEEILEEWEAPKPVESDVNEDQIFVCDFVLNIRKEASTSSQKMGSCEKNSFYNVLEVEKKSDFTWYNLGEQAWVAGVEGVEFYKKGTPRNIKEIKENIVKLKGQLDVANRALDLRTGSEYYAELNERVIDLNTWLDGKFDTLDYDLVDDHEYDEIDLLYTADVHGAWIGYDEHGNYMDPVFNYQDVGKYRDKLKDHNIKALLIDAGDFSRPCRVQKDYENEKIMYSSKEMNELGYFAEVYGNHEWRWSQYGAENTEVILNTAKNMTVCNLFKNGKLLYKPYRVAKIGSKRIAVIGIGYPSANGNGEYADGVWTYSYEGNTYTFYDDTKLFNQVQKYVDELKQSGVDYIVVLTHMCKSTYESDDRYKARTDTLIQNTKGLTAVIQGHYNNATNAEVIKDKGGNSVLLAHESGANFNSFGRLKIKGNEISSYLLDEQSDLEEI